MSTRKSILQIILAIAITLILTNSTPAQQEIPQQIKPPPIYDEKAAAQQQIAAALAKAAVNNKRVLIQWGANWCGWCTLLNNTFKEDKPVSQLISNEYELIHIDVARFDKHMDVAEKYGAKFKGIPHLTILDDRGGIIANLNTAILEEGPKHDPAKVLAFLDLCKPKPLNADTVYQRALARPQDKTKKSSSASAPPGAAGATNLTTTCSSPKSTKSSTRIISSSKSTRTA